MRSTYDLVEWLKEGIAEYIATGGKPASANPRVDAVRVMLASTRRIGRLAQSP
ncbi:hypothetical protein ACVCAH_27460 [Micromonospora sp. LZ34]